MPVFGSQFECVQFPLRDHDFASSCGWTLCALHTMVSISNPHSDAVFSKDLFVGWMRGRKVDRHMRNWIFTLELLNCLFRLARHNRWGSILTNWRRVGCMLSAITSILSLFTPLAPPNPNLIDSFQRRVNSNLSIVVVNCF